MAIDYVALAQAFGCASERVDSHERLRDVLEGVVPSLASREEPLLLEVLVEPDEQFNP